MRGGRGEGVREPVYTGRRTQALSFFVFLFSFYLFIVFPPGYPLTFSPTSNTSKPSKKEEQIQVPASHGVIRTKLDSIVRSLVH